MQVVYADVLIILNTYINFILLRMCGFFMGRPVSRFRLFLGALAGGVYSLIILVDGMPGLLSAVLKIAMCGIIVLISFPFNGIRSFLRGFFSFFLISFAFAGIMLALWIFVSPDTMLYNNGTVYFGFDTMTLLIITTVCYGIIRVLYFIAERRAPKAGIYELEIRVGDKVVKCRGLLDSGNSLRDYFTSLPVIMVSGDRLREIMPADGTADKELKVRYIPVSTVGGEGMVKVFRPDSIRLYSADCDFETKDVLIGRSITKIRNGEFEALLPCDIREGYIC